MVNKQCCDCGRRLYHNTTTRCKKCFSLFIRGKNNPNYKHGKAMLQCCQQCSKQLHTKYAKLCQACYLEHMKIHHPRLKHGGTLKTHVCKICHINTICYATALYGQGKCRTCSNKLHIRVSKHTSEAKLKMSAKRIEYLLKNGTNKKDTDIELIVKAELARRNLDHISQFRVKNRLADFYVPKHNLIIECDGAYWHNRPDRKLRDIQTTNLYKTQGYKVIRLSEVDIKTNLIPILDEILK